MSAEAILVRKSDLRPPRRPSMRCKSLPCWDCEQPRPIRDVHRRLCSYCYHVRQRNRALPTVDWSLLTQRLTLSFGDCIEWLGAINDQGYGTWRGEYTHRISFIIATGEPIPDGMTIDHVCRTPSCLNPDHLEAVTQRENNLRATRLITHCIHGHEFTPDNTRLRQRGAGTSRSCRTCDAEHEKRRVRTWS